MSQESFLKFLTAVRESPAMLARYNPRNISQLLFHAKNEGYQFTIVEMADVIGKLEASVILQKDQGPFDGTSRLWREMWGKYHLEYLIDKVLRRHTDAELQQLIAPAPVEASV